MNLHQMLYDIIVTYVYGGVAPTDIQAVAVEIFVILGWIFCLAIPFVVCWWFLRLLASVIERALGS